jgi:hypothetical protein
MKRFVAKAAIVAACVGALAAFVMPAMASAATWSPLGASKVLEAKEAEVELNGGVPGGWKCTNVKLNVTVRKAASPTLDVNGATFENCTAVDDQCKLRDCGKPGCRKGRRLDSVYRRHLPLRRYPDWRRVEQLKTRADVQPRNRFRPVRLRRTQHQNVRIRRIP